LRILLVDKRIQFINRGTVLALRVLFFRTEGFPV
jgi:hypothetical protein